MLNVAFFRLLHHFEKPQDYLFKNRAKRRTCRPLTEKSVKIAARLFLLELKNIERTSRKSTTDIHQTMSIGLSGMSALRVSGPTKLVV